MGSYEIGTVTDPCHQSFLFSFSGPPLPTQTHKINSLSISSEGNLLCSLDLKGYTDAELNVLSWICQLMLSHTYTPKFTNAKSNIHSPRYTDAKSNVHSPSYANSKSDLHFWKRLMTFYFPSRDHACVFLHLASMFMIWILPPH